MSVISFDLSLKSTSIDGTSKDLRGTDKQQ